MPVTVVPKLLDAIAPMIFDAERHAFAIDELRAFQVPELRAFAFVFDEMPVFWETPELLAPGFPELLVAEMLVDVAPEMLASEAPQLLRHQRTLDVIESKLDCDPLKAGTGAGTYIAKAVPKMLIDALLTLEELLPLDEPVLHVGGTAATCS